MLNDTRTVLSFLVLSLLIVGSLGASGIASCFGDYPSHLGSTSVVESGIANFIKGEDWTYTTALCSTWANSMAGACAQVSCVQGGAGASTGMKCTGSSTYVRVIDQLGNDCSGSPTHVFDLSDTPFNQIGSDGASCSGYMAINYSPVSCQTAGLVSGGIKIGMAPNECDPWCPAFVFSNVGGSGALYSVSVSPDGGNTWYPFKKNSAEGARWDCNGGSGKFLGNALSFKLTDCSISGAFSSCNAGDSVTIINALPSGWCVGGASPCGATSYQPSSNIASGSSSAPNPPPPTPNPPPPSPTGSSSGSTDPTIRCGNGWADANGKCGTYCTNNAQCTAPETCFASLSASTCGAADLADSSTQGSSFNAGLTAGQIAGIAVASVVMVVVVIGAVFLLRKRQVEEIV